MQTTSTTVQAPIGRAGARDDGFTSSNVGALLLGHCAGMLDLVGLPVWVGANLIGFYKFDPQKAGLLATVYLLCAVIASMLLAPRYGRSLTKTVTVVGYAVAALAFVALATFAGNDYPTMLVLHAIGGLGAGSALTMVDGTIGRSDNPHRMFAYAGVAVAVFGILVLGSGPAIIGKQGGTALWFVFAGVMGLAALVAVLAFPQVPAARQHPQGTTGRISRQVWFGIIGMSTLCMAHSMIFPFVERMGIDRGYSAGLVAGVLVSIGFANLVPSPLAAVLEKRLRPERAILGGTLFHMMLVLLVTQVSRLDVYMPVVAILTTPLLFMHTFLFGLMARLDPSGRSVAATPAMLMIGSAAGPALGGTLLVASGYSGLGIGVAAFGLLAAIFFSQIRGTR
ncbi:MAG: MFS transporter [Rhodoferax sp.]|nr:MFS transporter [Rhodoferax sp.]